MRRRLSHITTALLIPALSLAAPVDNRLHSLGTPNPQLFLRVAVVAPLVETGNLAPNVKANVDRLAALALAMSQSLQAVVLRTQNLLSDTAPLAGKEKAVDSLRNELRSIYSHALYDLGAPTLADYQPTSVIPYEKWAIDLFESSQDTVVRRYALKILIRVHSKMVPELLSLWRNSLVARANEAATQISTHRRGRGAQEEANSVLDIIMKRSEFREASLAILEIMLAMHDSSAPDLLRNAILDGKIRARDVRSALIEYGDSSLLPVLEKTVIDMDFHSTDDVITRRYDQAELMSVIASLGNPIFAREHLKTWLTDLKPSPKRAKDIDQLKSFVMLAYHLANGLISAGDTQGAETSLGKFFSSWSRPPIPPARAYIYDAAQYEEVEAARTLAVKLFAAGSQTTQGQALMQYLLAKPGARFKMTPSSDSAENKLRQVLQFVIEQDSETTERQKAAVALIAMGDEATIETVLSDIFALATENLTRYWSMAFNFKFLESLLKVIQKESTLSRQIITTDLKSGA